MSAFDDLFSLEAAAPAAPTPCPRPFDPKVCGPHATHRCRIGGGDACYSDDGGRTWFCTEHVADNFHRRAA